MTRLFEVMIPYQNDRIVISAMGSCDYELRTSLVYSYLQLTNVGWAEHPAAFDGECFLACLPRCTVFKIH